jgi:hypothetical protein
MIRGETSDADPFNWLLIRRRKGVLRLRSHRHPLRLSVSKNKLKINLQKGCYTTVAAAFSSEPRGHYLSLNRERNVRVATL